MLRQITAKKLDRYTQSLDEGTRAVAASLAKGKMTNQSKRKLLAMVNSVISEVGSVYDALRTQASSTRNLIAASRSNDFESGLQRIVGLATRLDLIRTALAGDLGVDPEAPVVDEEEELPADYTVTAQELVDELGGTDIPTPDPKEVATEQPTVQDAATEESSPEPETDYASEPEGIMGLEEEGEDYEDVEDEDEDISFESDDVPEDALPGVEAEEEPPVEEPEVPVTAKARARKVRSSVTAKRNTQANVGDALKGLWDFISK